MLFEGKNIINFSAYNSFKQFFIRDSLDFENETNFRENYFFSSLPAFWVAEYKGSERKEIVGTIGLRHVVDDVKEMASNHGIESQFDLRVSSKNSIHFIELCFT